MLAVPWLYGFLPGFCQDLERTDFDIQTDWVGSLEWRRQAIADEIVFGLEKSTHYIVYQFRVNDRAISRDTYDCIGLELLCGLIVTVQYIKLTAARKRDSARVAVLGDGIVRRVRCRGDQSFMDSSRSRGPRKDAPQHRLSRDVQQDFPGQA